MFPKSRITGSLCTGVPVHVAVCMQVAGRKSRGAYKLACVLSHLCWCRRKGMSSEVTVSQYFDDQMLLELARQDADLQGLF